MVQMSINKNLFSNKRSFKNLFSIRRNSKNLFSTKKNKKKVGLLVVVVLLFLCALCIGVVVIKNTRPVVMIKVQDNSIYQYEELSGIEVKASTAKKNQKIVLNKKENYLVKDLLKDLNSGEGYKLKYDIDNRTAGTYTVELELSKELKKKVSYLWWNKIKIQLENGSFEVIESKVDPTKLMIALTFDDGPGKYTDKLLDILEENDARATFFMVGENVSKYSEAVERMKEIGCEIGNHTTNHTKLTELEVSEVISQIEGTNNLLLDIIEEKSTVVRPPYGEVNSVVRENVEYPLIMWSVDTLDWKTKDAKKVKEYTLKNVADGDIVLMHDIHQSTVKAAETIIPKLIEQGYQLVTVSEMARARGIEMKNGEKYFSFK